MMSSISSFIKTTAELKIELINGIEERNRDETNFKNILIKK